MVSENFSTSQQKEHGMAVGMNGLAHGVAEDIMAVSQEAESETKASLDHHLQSLTSSDPSITTKPRLLKGSTTSKTAAPAGDQLLKCKSLRGTWPLPSKHPSRKDPFPRGKPYQESLWMQERWFSG